MHLSFQKEFSNFRRYAIAPMPLSVSNTAENSNFLIAGMEKHRIQIMNPCIIRMCKRKHPSFLKGAFAYFKLTCKFYK